MNIYVGTGTYRVPRACEQVYLQENNIGQVIRQN
jgi:hypothetical protein